MTLYVVATPIGNLEDITLRALRILKEVDFIVAEDTRKTGNLLKHFEIQTRLTSFFEHQEEKKLPFLMEQLQGGKKLALVTDAGTPGISDPGFRLIRAAIAKEIPVIPVPGCSALLCALQGSGLPTDHFFFCGFLPEKPGKRRKQIESLREFPHTLIFYLSRWKAATHVEDLLNVLGERQAVLGRELTKWHEEFWRGTLKEILLKFQEKNPKGEMTLIVSGKES